MSLRRIVLWIVGLVVLALIFQFFFRYQYLQQGMDRQTITLVKNYVGESSSSPIPRPSATNCAMFEQMYPPTNEAFEEHHLSAKQQAEVRKWVAKMSSDDKRYAKWWLAPSRQQFGPPHLLVFSAEPLNDGVITWTAVNTNVWINPVDCDYYPYPRA